MADITRLPILEIAYFHARDYAFSCSKSLRQMADTPICSELPPFETVPTSKRCRFCRDIGPGGA
jgi:hypothetical protein